MSATTSLGSANTCVGSGIAFFRSVMDGSSTSESSNLPELVSWEQRLQQARVWPYDMTVYLRVFLYAAIGVSSWVGAALVERFIGAFFG